MRDTSMNKELFALELSVGPWFVNSLLLYSIEDQDDVTLFPDK